MANRIDSGIHLVLTYKESMAILRAMAEARFTMEEENEQEGHLPREEAEVARAWDRVKLKIYDGLSDSAEHAT
jgi:hypothetical protein